MTTRQKITNTINLAFKAVGLAMGVATLALSIMGSIEMGTAVTVLSLGLACVGVSLLGGKSKE